MPLYRDNLPLLSGDIFITEGGIETTLLFRHGIELPCFSAIHLIRDDAGIAMLRDCLTPYLSMARDHRVGFVFVTPTWRASRDWAEPMGYSESYLEDLSRRSVEVLEELREEWATEISPMVIAGCMGPRGDGYSIANRRSVAESQAYHRTQLELLAGTGVDLCSAMTMTYTDEAIGLVNAARAVKMPISVSFTLETNGKLPSGETLQEAIETVDVATDAAPIYYMINCVHPTHFIDHLAAGEPWVKRLRGIRANASMKSHDELDDSTELDAGDPEDLGAHYKVLRETFPHITVLGGCCGTDERHLAAICQACVPREG